MFEKRSFWVLSLSVVLAACGGGGGDEGGNGNSTPAGPLEKYVGSYSYCDQDHTKYSLSLTNAGNQDLYGSIEEVTYQNSNCSGDVLGTYKWKSPATISYISTGVATVNAAGLPASLSIDKVKMTLTTQATLTGPGVTGNCLKYPGGNVCYDLSINSASNDGGLYISGSKLYELSLENGVYVLESPYIKN